MLNLSINIIYKVGREFFSQVAHVLLFCGVLALAACSAPQHAPQVNHWMIHQSERVLHESDLPSFDLLDAAAQPALMAYIKAVLAHNPDLQSIRATISATRHLVETVAAQRRPQLSASINANRDKPTFESAPTNLIELTSSISWSLDLWGMIEDEKAAAELTVLQQQQTLQWASRILAARALDIWIVSTILEQQIIHLDAQQKLQASVTKIAREQYQSGLLSYEAWLEQQNITKSLAINYQDLLHQHRQSRFLMNGLRGKHPNEIVDTFYAGSKGLLVPLPTNISALALLNRPDILSAFTQIEILDKQTKAAYKALLPQITLTGKDSKMGSSLNEAFGETTLWALVGGLSQPILNGGDLRAHARSASSEAKSAFWRYQYVVLQALQEVETVLSQERALHANVQHQQAMLRNQRQLHEIRLQQYRRGDVSVNDYLQSNILLLDTERQLLNQHSLYLSNRVALTLALGEPLERISEEYTGEAADGY
ncbi:MAG: outer membrane protein TolC [Paraglaciecola sp.]|jgi:outer membrane protein TolC